MQHSHVFCLVLKFTHNYNEDNELAAAFNKWDHQTKYLVIQTANIPGRQTHTNSSDFHTTPVVQINTDESNLPHKNVYKEVYKKYANSPQTNFLSFTSTSFMEFPFTASLSDLICMPLCGIKSA